MNNNVSLISPTHLSNRHKLSSHEKAGPIFDILQKGNVEAFIRIIDDVQRYPKMQTALYQDGNLQMIHIFLQRYNWCECVQAVIIQENNLEMLQLMLSYHRQFSSPMAVYMVINAKGTFIETYIKTNELPRKALKELAAHGHLNLAEYYCLKYDRNGRRKLKKYFESLAL